MSQNANPMDSIGVIHTMAMEYVRSRFEWWDTTYADSTYQLYADFLIAANASDTVTPSLRTTLLSRIMNRVNANSSYTSLSDSVNDLVLNLPVSTYAKDVVFRLFDALVESEDDLTCNHVLSICDSLVQVVGSSSLATAEKAYLYGTISVAYHSSQYWSSRLNANGDIYKQVKVMLPDTTKRVDWSTVAANDVLGASLEGAQDMAAGGVGGAVVGSVFPGVGTALGAATGLLGGLVEGVIRGGISYSLEAGLGQPKIGPGGSWYDSTPRKDTKKKP
ncbi:hypothetical protein [Aphanothece microscopica]|uniref:hypothetical protein n=1 Tax=Aphanothece microscopica TaxID=1049561 RepID=UPI003CE4EF72